MESLTIDNLIYECNVTLVPLRNTINSDIKKIQNILINDLKIGESLRNKMLKELIIDNRTIVEVGSLSDMLQLRNNFLSVGIKSYIQVV